TPVTNICGAIGILPAGTTISLGVFEPVNQPPTLLNVGASTPTFVVETKSQGGNQVSVTLQVSEQDLNGSDRCVVGDPKAFCSDRPNLKTFLFGSFTFSSAPGSNCLAGCLMLDISNATSDPQATVQMFASTKGAPQKICVVVVDQTINPNAVPAIVSA